MSLETEYINKFIKEGLLPILVNLLENQNIVIRKLSLLAIGNICSDDT